MKIYITIGFLLLGSFAFHAIGQSQDELKLLMAISQGQEQQPEYNNMLNNSTFVGVVFGQLFLFYKVAFSSQDYSSCSFHPSCSEYAIETVNKQGLIIGILDAFDRLTRCNGLSPEHYHINIDLHLLEDPVRNLHYEVVE